MSMTKLNIRSLLVLLSFSLSLVSISGYAGNAEEASNLEAIKVQFLKSKSSRSARAATKERRTLEIAESALLNSGAASISKILQSRSPSDEQLRTIADFLAHTSQRDGSHLVLEGVMSVLGKDFDPAILKVEQALTRLRVEKKVTLPQAESVGGAIEVVRASGHGDD